MARLGKYAELFHRRTDYAENSSRGVDSRQVMLLDGSQCLGRSGIAGEYYQAAAAAEKIANRFKREAVNDIKRAGAIRGAGVVAEIYVIVGRERAAYFLEDGKAAVAGIEDSNWPGF